MDVTYSHTYILDNAVENPGDDGKWRKTVVDVKAGETAYLPGSTKRVVYGPCKLQYDIHPSGIILKHL